MSKPSRGGPIPPALRRLLRNKEPAKKQGRACSRSTAQRDYPARKLRELVGGADGQKITVQAVHKTTEGKASRPSNHPQSTSQPQHSFPQTFARSPCDACRRPSMASLPKTAGTRSAHDGCSKLMLSWTAALCVCLCRGGSLRVLLPLQGQQCFLQGAPTSSRKGWSAAIHWSHFTHRQWWSVVARPCP